MQARIALVLLLLVGSAPVDAQTLYRNNEILDSERPEAWAMHTVLAATLLTSTGEAPTLEPGRWQVALDLAQVPRLSDEEQRVGFNGIKQEDLNRAPVFG